MNQPLTNDGSSCRSARLVVRGNIIEVRPTKRNLLGKALFGLFGLFAGLLPTYLEKRILWPFALGGGVFFLIGCGLLISELRKPRPLLNLSLRLFFPKGMKAIPLKNCPEQIAFAHPLNNITHLEILNKTLFTHTKSGTHSFTCYELNVVLNDSSRYNLLNHGNKKALKEDACLLAEILNLQIQED